VKRAPQRVWFDSAPKTQEESSAITVDALCRQLRAEIAALAEIENGKHDHESDGSKSSAETIMRRKQQYREVVARLNELLNAESNW
jgi:hypothetical protein